MIIPIIIDTVPMVIYLENCININSLFIFYDSMNIRFRASATTTTMTEMINRKKTRRKHFMIHNDLFLNSFIWLAFYLWCFLNVKSIDNGFIITAKKIDYFNMPNIVGLFWFLSFINNVEDYDGKNCSCDDHTYLLVAGGDLFLVFFSRTAHIIQQCQNDSHDDCVDCQWIDW